MSATAIKSSEVNVDSAPFERANDGRKPRGNGTWAFCPYDKYRGDDYLQHTAFFHGSYGEAKKAARGHFAALGIASVVVCS